MMLSKVKPNNSKWSDEQWQAIYTEGCNILVSAGAGSGKTTVLTERIIQKLCNGVKLEDLIVVTFTVAAASEMKERIRKKLSEEIKKGRNDLNSELDYIDQANIETFDAFALGLVKKYHYVLGLPKNVNIGDSSLFKVKAYEIIDDIFNKMYEEEDPDFFNLLKAFTLKNDESLKKTIININDKLSLLVDRKKYVNDYSDVYFSDEFIDDKIKEYVELLFIEIERIEVLFKELRSFTNDEILLAYLDEYYKNLKPLLNADNYDEILRFCDITVPTIPKKVEDLEGKEKIRSEKDKIKKSLDKIKTLLIYKNTNEMKEEILETKPYVLKLLLIAEKLNDLLFEYKIQNNIYDFADISKMAISLLKDNYEIRCFIKDKTNEILVDEYQDTSDIQEELVSLIGNNNLYMVGDIKQSIYRFRNANPNIFKNRYKEYQHTTNAVNIDLVKNYRSRSEVIKGINVIFDRLMDLRIGGVDYSRGNALIYGNLKYDENSIEDNNIVVNCYEVEEGKKFSAAEIEANIIAKDIIDKISNKFVVLKGDKLDIVKYSDFSILTSTRKDYETYKMVFEYYQIPLVVYSKQTFINSYEIIALKNILKCVYSLNDNDYFKDNFYYSLASVLRSFLVEGPDDEIYDVFEKLEKKAVFEKLNLRFPKVFENLNKISLDSQKCTLGQIIDEICQLFEVYKKIYLLPGASEVENKINFLQDKAHSLTDAGYGIKDFINFLDKIDELDLDIEYIEKSSNNTNAVSILTIHQSKGLEYPICYFPSLTTKFNNEEIKEKIFFEERVGLVTPINKEGIKETILKQVAKFNYKLDDIGEELRLLYVALTRTREKSIIVVPMFEESLLETRGKVSYNDKISSCSFYQFLNLVKDSLKEYTKTIVINDIPNFRFQKIKKLDQEKIDKSKDIKTYNVSLNKVLEKRIIASANKLSTSGDEVKVMRYGTIIHKYLELIDFKKDLNTQLETIDDLWAKSKFEKFFDNDVFSNKIINDYHEHYFSYEENNTLISGIIDLLLETDDKYIVIDYKLSNIEKVEYVKQLKVYKTYLKKFYNKEVETYLYSINNNELRKIE